MYHKNKMNLGVFPPKFAEVGQIAKPPSPPATTHFRKRRTICMGPKFQTGKLRFNFDDLIMEKHRLKTSQCIDWKNVPFLDYLPSNESNVLYFSDVHKQ